MTKHLLLLILALSGCRPDLTDDDFTQQQQEIIDGIADLRDAHGGVYPTPDDLLAGEELQAAWEARQAQEEAEAAIEANLQERYEDSLHMQHWFNDTHFDRTIFPWQVWYDIKTGNRYWVIMDNCKSVIQVVPLGPIPKKTYRPSEI